VKGRTVGAELVGLDLPPAEFAWEPRDAILYALGVGADPVEELDCVYESRGPRVLPTFALIPNWWAVKDLGRVVDHQGRPMVHAAQVLRLQRDLPPTGRVTARASISAVWDKGTNTLIEVTGRADDEEGLLFETRSATMILGLGGWGGERGPSGGGEPAPERPPDVVVASHIDRNQGAIYRLSGDLNPLHIDPEAARAAGFDDVFLHGLCTLGVAGRAVLRAGPGTARLAHIETRFASPLYLDRTLETRVWLLDAGEVRFAAYDGERAILTNGRATLEPA
jgi:acyl dehydratase